MISSVDDLRSSMGCMNPDNEEQRQRIIRHLIEELDFENSYKYRDFLVNHCGYRQMFVAEW